MKAPTSTARQGWTRRRWLSAMAAPCVVPASVVGRNHAVPPNERIAVAVIGLGAMGQGHLRAWLGRPDVVVVGLCDVDQTRREHATQMVAESHRKSQTSIAKVHVCADYRELLAREDVDAVVLATPDHWHALQSIDTALAARTFTVKNPLH